MIITDQNDLNGLCAALSRQPYITVDTEFLRERTYYPQLCLVQVAPPVEVGEPVAIDPLAGLDLAPLLAVMNDARILKIFHAARQDLEIFYNMTGQVPHPIFDTQVAAMVCGFGDQVGYNTLIAEICGEKLDKGAQFTDWSRRPLSDKQLSYALDDVHYLRHAYLKLSSMLKEQGREGWVEQEVAILNSVDTYRNPPEHAWERIKIKSDKPQVIAVLKELAAWREEEAQRRNIPRNRVMRDEVLADLAVHPPRTLDELKRMRGVGDEVARSRHGGNILEAVQKGLAVPKGEGPVAERRERFPSDLQPVLEMLKMLLRIVAAEQGVAARLIASGEDLEALARGEDSENPVLKGWRYEIFGREALDMKKGRLALSLEKGRVVKKPSNNGKSL